MATFHDDWSTEANFAAFPLGSLGQNYEWLQGTVSVSASGAQDLEIGEMGSEKGLVLSDDSGIYLHLPEPTLNLVVVLVSGYGYDIRLGYREGENTPIWKKGVGGSSNIVGKETHIWKRKTGALDSVNIVRFSSSESLIQRIDIEDCSACIDCD